MGVLALVGTVKGGFLLRSNDARDVWTVDGPIFRGWKVTAALRARGRTFVATASDVYGAAIHVSKDLRKWKQIEKGPIYPKPLKRKLNQIWTLRAGASSLYAGVDEAGLFTSADGAAWSAVKGLNEHPTRRGWMPGAGGLCAHSVVEDAANPKRIWCGISAVGVFRSDDGGRRWTPKNRGVKICLEDKKHKDIGFCVHSFAQDPRSPDTLYRREHTGVYRSRDAGESWERIEKGLPSGFGFPLAVDRAGTLYCVPEESDEYRTPTEGKLRAYRSRNGGDSWEALSRGLPQEHFYGGVLRGAMAVDNLDPCGVYFGTTAGTVHVSPDGGDNWKTLRCTLARVLCVAVLDA